MPERDWGVAVFVVRNDRVLLHQHERLHRWLPPGGHIEPNEIPDEAAIREVREETGVHIELIDAPLITLTAPNLPRMLARPLGIMLVDIRPDHQHIDLVYLARATNDGDGRGTWFTITDLATLDLTEEIRAWCTLALGNQ